MEFHRELTRVVDRVRRRTGGLSADAIRMRSGALLPLLPLAEQCHHRPRTDWRHLVERYVHRGLDLLGDGIPMPRAPSTIDLRVRLVPSSPIDEALLAGIGARPYTQDLAAVPVLVGHGGLRTLTADEVEQIGWDAEEAWESAWEQTADLERPDEIDSVSIAGTEVVHVFGASALTASLVPSLERQVGPLGRDGALVGLPCDHTVLVHPIDGATSRQVIGSLVPIVRRMHADGPGSLSPQLYWWRNGALTWIPTVFGGETNEVYLPAGLDDALS